MSILLRKLGAAACRRWFLPLAAVAAAPVAFGFAAAAGPGGPQRRLAVTIDDLPLVSVPEGNAADYREVTRRLLAGLRRYDVPAVGFVNESRLVRDGSGDSVDLSDHLRMWLDAGFELGNHTYAHQDLHVTPLSEFEAGILRGERVTRPLVEAGVPAE